MKRAWTRIAVVAVLATATAAGGPAELEKPFRLEADGAPIDTGAHIAHAGPLYADYDGDQVPDLLVGNFRGHIQVYKNVGSKKAPKFKGRGLLQVNGKPLQIKNW